MTQVTIVPRSPLDTTPHLTRFPTLREIGDRRAALRPWHCLGRQLETRGPWIPSARMVDSTSLGLTWQVRDGKRGPPGDAFYI